MESFFATLCGACLAMKRRQKANNKGAAAEKKTKAAENKVKNVFSFFFSFFFFYLTLLQDGEKPKKAAAANVNKPKPEFKVSYTLKGHKGAVSATKFSRDGKLLASCSADKTCKIWNAYDGEFQWDMVGHR
jgi:WD40 repeat protein